MPRKARFYLPNIPAHVMQRGHNWDPVFFEVQDYLEYLKILKGVAEVCRCTIHAYVLMTNHIHLLLTPATGDAISRLFRECGRRTLGTSTTPTVDAVHYGKDAIRS
jgi:putative transposase